MSVLRKRGGGDRLTLGFSEMLYNAFEFARDVLKKRNLCVRYRRNASGRISSDGQMPVRSVLW